MEATTQSIQTIQKKVIERVNLMKEDPQIQKIMLQFEDKQAAIDWLYKAAIATLYGI